MGISSSHAGHGGKKTGGRWADSGAVGSGQQEATLAREINDKIIKYTKAKDSTDNSGANSNAILANTSANIRKSGSGWHISNHLNAFNGSAHGVEVLYGADSDKYMAERVSKAISDATGLTNRGAKDGKWLYIANNSSVNDKVLLIEWCFIDNKSDVEKLQKNMDEAIQAMLKCFDYNVKVDTTPPKRKTPQGDWIKENKKVKVTKKDEKIWSNFDWKFRTNTNDVINKEFNVTGKYNHENGYTYYSLYDNKGGWHGYINKGFVTEVNYDINKGDKVKLHNFASKYQTGQSIPGWVKKGTYTVIKKEKLTKKQSKSTYKYLLSNINSWVLGQDIYKV